MDNYEYIISSLPLLEMDSSLNTEAVIEEIREQCSAKDNSVISSLLKGFDEKQLDRNFYLSCLESENRFIREYFLFDLNVRNAKVRTINKALNRPMDLDVISITDEDYEFEELSQLESILEGKDILVKEKALDQLMWRKIDELTTFNYFDLDAILGFITKLHITDRWFKLDENTGRELFRKLVEEIRGTFKGAEHYN